MANQWRIESRFPCPGSSVEYVHPHTRQLDGPFAHFLDNSREHDVLTLRRFPIVLTTIPTLPQLGEDLISTRNDSSHVEQWPNPSSDLVPPMISDGAICTRFGHLSHPLSGAVAAWARGPHPEATVGISMETSSRSWYRDTVAGDMVLNSTYSFGSPSISSQCTRELRVCSSMVVLQR